MEEKLKNDIKNLIAQVKVLNEKHDAIKKINGENFNIFSILNMETDEVKTHSYFIYNLINPNGSHDQGDIFLKLFLEQILTNDEYKDIGEIQRVKREDPTNKNRRIDFTIETSNFLIAIEMKIYASDQTKQLSDYYNHIKNKKPNTKLYYLTLFGADANKKSTQHLKENRDYYKISFNRHIYFWLEQCIEKSATIPTLREGLVQYRNLIRKITNQTSNERGKDMEKIIVTQNDIEAANIIKNDYPIVWAKKEVDFWTALRNEIKKEIKNYNIIIYEDMYLDDKTTFAYTNIANQRDNGDFFGLTINKDLDDINILSIDIYFDNRRTTLKNRNTIIIDLEIYKVEINEDNSIINDELLKIIKSLNFNLDGEIPPWQFINQEIKFYGKYINNPSFELFDKTKFNDLVKNTKNEIIELINKISKREKEILTAIENK